MRELANRTRPWCPLCDAPEVNYEFTTNGKEFFRCRACTLFFANPASAKGKGFEPLGTEARGALRAFAARYLGRDPRTVLILDGSLEQSALPATNGGHGYDLIIAHGVIEQSARPLDAALALRQVVAEDGALLLVAPSIGSKDARDARELWNLLQSKATCYFDADTVQLLLTRACFGKFAPIVDPDDMMRSPNREIRRLISSHLAIVCGPVSSQARHVLSVIMPVFNEVATVGEMLDRVLAKTIDGIDIEVVVVDSNSTDGSRDIVSCYANHPRVRVVLEERTCGKGHAVRAALPLISGEVVLFQDADLEYDVQDYDELVEPLFKLRRNFVLGSRHGVGTSWSKIRRFKTRPLVSHLMNLGHTIFARIFNQLYDQQLRDPFTMYKVFRRDCLYGLVFSCDRFDFDYEIVIKLIRKGYQPLEIPVNYESRSYAEGKKIRFFADPPTWIRAMLRLRRSPLYSFEE